MRSFHYLTSLLGNLAMILAIYTICRIEFLFENQSLFTIDWKSDDWIRLFCGGIVFDISAICYTNLIYIIGVVFPCHFKENITFHNIIKWLFVIINSFAIVINFADSVYYPFSKHRVTSKVFNEFGNESNIGKLIGYELLNHWYLFLLAFIMILVMWKLYRSPLQKVTSLKRYYIQYTLSTIILVTFVVFGMRGAIGYTSSRPITISNAHQYVQHPAETGIVLNTPFSLIRTFNKRPPKVPVFFNSSEELDSIYTPIHYPVEGCVPNKKNVVILIVESFASEFIGSLNKSLDNGKYKGYTPFIDAFIPHCLTFDNTFCNTNVSIDAMPAVLASIPLTSESFVLSPYSLNHINSIASTLKAWDYESAFFHGADNGSMGFQAFAAQAGFNRYYGRTEYNQDRRFNGDKDFDGTWAIWDEEFLQFYALKMSEMREPFVTSVFTATSHHPFAIPLKYKNKFLDEGQYEIHKCIRYTDNALKHFFKTASKQPWFKNTIFVITADHASSRTTHAEYKTEYGNCKVPILIYSPDSTVKKGKMSGIMQQIDIMPTLLGILGYDRPFIAFGRNVFEKSTDEGWSINWHLNPQFIMGDFFMQTDADINVTSLYNYKKDPLLKNNLAGKRLQVEWDMLTKLKAIVQSYMMRMENDNISFKHSQ